MTTTMVGRLAVTSMVAVMLVGGCLSTGCANVTKENVEPFLDFLKQGKNRVNVQLDDPSLLFFVRHESSVGTRVEGASGTSSAQFDQQESLSQMIDKIMEFQRHTLDMFDARRGEPGAGEGP